MADKKKDSKLDNLLLGTVVGAAIGSVIGVSLAPESGKKTRKKISKETERVYKESAKNVDKMGKSVKNGLVARLRRFREYLKKRNEQKRSD